MLPERDLQDLAPTEDFVDDFDANILKAEKVLKESESSKTSVAASLSAVEISPFESVKSFICSYCPKRSQSLDRIRRHHAECHADKSLEFQELTRDQVVNIITSDQYAATGDKDYKCFYCQEIGSIKELQEHNEQLHQQGVFRVVRFQSKGVTGYLECQVCGYLSPGFEKYFQKAHFHEEHPMQNEVNCSKYMNKVKGNVESFSGSQQTFKFDVNDVVGMTFSCPKEKWGDCNYATQILSQMNTHLRKHTKTYKCGHCGKTFLDNSEFHRHSAMTHGDKIPDLVKDPEAEAEYEALKGLLEEEITRKIACSKLEGDAGPARRLVARKSTDPECRARPGDVCRNTSRKSTGAGAKFWPETRIQVPYSFYGIPADPYDPKHIKTRMAMGGIEITLDAEKMGELLNLKPKLVLEDCKNYEDLMLDS